MTQLPDGDVRPTFDVKVSRFGAAGVLEYAAEHEGIRGRRSVDGIVATHLASFGPCDRMLLEVRRRQEDVDA